MIRGRGAYTWSGIFFFKKLGIVECAIVQEYEIICSDMMEQ